MSSTSDQDIQTTIHQAIQSARYNEAVIVTASDDDGNAREIVLVACLDKEHGGIVWRDASSCTSEEASIDDIGIVRHLRTKLWAIPMLNDHVRNAMYDGCVKEACRTVVERRLQEADGDDVIRILDIGSGTGLIAMMAAKHCKDAIIELQKSQPEKRMRVQVTSVEMASAMVRLARLTIDENKSVIEGGEVYSGIAVVECHSTDEEFFIQDSRFKEQSNIASYNRQARYDEAQQQQHLEPKKADLCTSELLDSGLLGEGVLPSLRDAWKRHLKPDAIILPRAARVVAMLVEGYPVDDRGQYGDSSSLSRDNLNTATVFYGPDLDSFHRTSGGVWLATTPHKTDSACCGIDGVLLGVQRVGTENRCHPNSSKGITFPLHADAMIGDHNREGFSASLFNPLQEYDGYPGIPHATINNEESKVIGVKNNNYRIRPLTDPMPVLSFDFASGLSAFPSSDGRSIPTIFVPTADGVADGVLFWWELELGEGEANVYSTVPLGSSKTTASEGSDMQWQDHWQQVLFLFGDGDRTRELTKGCPINVLASHDDYSISFAISDSSQIVGSRPVARRKLNDGSDSGVSPLAQPKIKQHISSARALQLNDTRRTEVLRDAILYALHTKGTKAPFLDLSDMGLCALIAAVSGTTCITSFESNMSTLAATIAQIGNELPKDDSIFQVIEALSENVTSDYIAGNKAAEIVAAEPYYQMLEGWHIQEALNYFYLVRSFKSRGLISESAVSVPALAYVMVCVCDFQELCDAYGKVGDTDEMVCGFQHQTVNYYGDRYHTHDMSLPLWQYRWKRLSKPCCVARFCYEGVVPVIEDGDWVTTEFDFTGNANAVVFWVDYFYYSDNGTHKESSSNDRFSVISTASSCHRQVVRKLATPLSVGKSDLAGNTKFICKSKFDGRDVNDTQDHCFSYKVVVGNKS